MDSLELLIQKVMGEISDLRAEVRADHERTRVELKADVKEIADALKAMRELHDAKHSEACLRISNLESDFASSKQANTIMWKKYDGMKDEIAAIKDKMNRWLYIITGATAVLIFLDVPQKIKKLFL